MIFLSVASGYTSSHKIATFCKANASFFEDYFALEQANLLTLLDNLRNKGIVLTLEGVGQVVFL